MASWCWCEDELPYVPLMFERLQIPTGAIEKTATVPESSPIQRLSRDECAVLDRSAILIKAAGSLENIASVQVPASPYKMNYFDGKLTVGCRPSNTVALVDIQQRQVANAISCPSEPMWVSSVSTDNLVGVELRNNQVGDDHTRELRSRQ